MVVGENVISWQLYRGKVSIKISVWLRIDSNSLKEVLLQFTPDYNLNIPNEIKEKNKLLTQQNRRNRGLHRDATYLYQTWTVAFLGRYQLTSYTQAEWLVCLLAGGGKRRAHRSWREASVQASGLQQAKTATNQPSSPASHRYESRVILEVERDQHEHAQEPGQQYQCVYTIYSSPSGFICLV